MKTTTLKKNIVRHLLLVTLGLAISGTHFRGRRETMVLVRYPQWISPHLPLEITGVMNQLRFTRWQDGFEPQEHLLTAYPPPGN